MTHFIEVQFNFQQSVTTIFVNTTYKSEGLLCSEVVLTPRHYHYQYHQYLCINQLPEQYIKVHRTLLAAR
jgi:hypothetical protein